MERTTVVLPNELRERLRLVAAERGVSMADLIREGAEEVLRKYRPKLRIFGIAESARGDVSRRSTVEPVVPEPWR
jgi:Arc/MetJ-type ribon-helix-helix transcriptional regulator